MSFYDDMNATVAELLTEFGQPVTVIRYSLGVEDNTTGVITIPDPTITTEIGALLDFQYRSFGDSVEPNEFIGMANKRLLMTTNTKIKPGDHVIADGDEYRIVVIKVVNPAGTRVVYDIWIQF